MIRDSTHMAVPKIRGGTLFWGSYNEDPSI